MQTNINNNSFQGVVWDEASLDVLSTVAKALLNLTEVFASQNIHIEMIKVNNSPNEEVIK